VGVMCGTQAGAVLVGPPATWAVVRMALLFSTLVETRRRPV